MEGFIAILVIGIMLLVIALVETLSTRKESEEKTKQCNVPQYAFKCPNCHCDELNRGR